MTTAAQEANRPFGAAEPGQFYPVARFHPDMDVIQYLNEDVSYRAERVDGTLTLLWHPQEERLVGIALKGFRLLFRHLREKHGISEDRWLPLVTALEEALVLGAAEEIMADEMAKRERREKRERQYETARRFAATVGVPSSELRRAA